MLDQKILTYFNGLVLPHQDYADIVWGDQPTQMKQDPMKGSIPEHFGVFRSAMNQIIPEMATCPKTVGQERNWEKAKYIIKPYTTGQHYQVLYF